MGWKDCHLHQFQVINPISNEREFMGIPDDEDFDIHNTLPGWDYKVKKYITTNPKLLYEYDFGDCWTHTIEYEGEHTKHPNQKYPVCLAGERACPPEDVGGVPGFFDFISVISNPNHEEYESMMAWAGGSYDPGQFDPQQVKFDSPAKRWNYAIGVP